MHIRFLVLFAMLVAFTLTACGKPTEPESPDPSTYGQTIEPDHNVPAEHRNNN